MVELNDTRHSNIRRIQQRISAARIGNIRTRGVLASGDKPSVSVSASAPAGTYAPYPATLNGGTTASDYAPYVASSGGWSFVNSSGLQINCLTQTIGAATGGSVSTAYQGHTRLQMYIDGDTLIVGLRNSTATWRLIVDGQYEDLAGHTNADTGLKYWTFDFTACTRPRKTRKIELEFPGAGAVSAPILLAQIYTKLADSPPYAPTTNEVGPRAILSLDSYGLGAGATIGGDGFSRIAGDYLGLDDVWSQGRSGGSYMRGTNADVGPTPIEAITDITAWAPDLLIFGVGLNAMINDGGTVRAGTISAENEAAAALATVSAVRLALPRVPIIVFGPWRAGTTTARNKQASFETAIFSAINGLSDPYITTQSTGGLLTGTGRVGATAGDGNSDYYISADNTHPPTVGHEYIGQWFAGRVANALQSMIA